MTTRTRHWLEVLKVAGVVVGVLASAAGSYQAAKSKARTEADASFQELKQAVEHLEQTQQMIWQVVMKSPPAATKSFDSDMVSRVRPFPGMRQLPRNLDGVMSKR